MTTVLDLTVSTAQHREELDEVKRRVGVTHNDFDGWIFNFLENKNFNVEETVAKLHRRADFEQKELAKIEITEAMKENMREGVIQLIGDDKEGRCTFYITTRRDKPSAKMREMRTKIFDMWLAYGTRLRESNPKCRITMLINQEGAGVWANTDMTFQSNIALRIAKYYPGVVDKMYICNMGSTLAAFAKPIFSRLPAAVSDRIFILTDGDIKGGKLLELFDEQTLPIPLGGKNDCDNQQNYNNFCDTISDYWEKVHQAIQEGIPVKEWELQRMREAAATTRAAIIQESDLRLTASFVDDTATMGTCYSDGDEDNYGTRVSYEYEESYVEIEETADRTALLRDEELVRYALVHRCAHERTTLADTDRLDGPQVSNAILRAFPAPARSLVKSALWVLAIIMTVYFVAATIYIGLIVAGSMGVLFFGVLTNPLYIAPLGVLTFLFAYQLALIASRGVCIIESTFRGHLICPVNRMGTKGFIVQYAFFLCVVVIQFIIFVYYAATVDPLWGIRISFATGWLSAGFIIAAFHLAYPFGVIEDENKKEGNRGNISLFLLFDITEQDDRAKNRKSAIIISLVPVSLSVLFGVGFLATKLLFFLAATPVATAFAAATISYFAGERERSVTVPITRAACWFTCEAWLFAVLAGGTVNITSDWNISIYCNAGLAVLFCIIVGFAANVHSTKGSLWYLRVAYALLGAILVAGIVIAFTLHWGLGLLALVLTLHATPCWWRGNATNLGGYLIVLATMICTCLAVILLSVVATPTTYHFPRSLGPAVLATPEGQRDNLFLRFPVCLASVKGFSVTELALLCESTLADTPTVRDIDLAAWLPHVTYERMIFSDVSVGTLHVYNSTAGNAKVVVLKGPTETNYVFQAVTIWAESMTMVPFSVAAPSEWVTGLVKVVSYLQTFIPFPWIHGLEGIEAAIRALNVSSNVVITGHSMGGSLAGIVGARMKLPVIAFSAAGITYQRGKFGLSSDAVSQNVMGIKSSNSALSGVDTYGDSSQVLQCSDGVTACSSIEFFSLKLMEVCPQPFNRTHTPLDLLH